MYVRSGGRVGFEDHWSEEEFHLKVGERRGMSQIYLRQGSWTINGLFYTGRTGWCVFRVPRDTPRVVSKKNIRETHVDTCIPTSTTITSGFNQTTALFER